MKSKSLWRYAPPAGPLLGLLLIGLVLLSALLYYRAVKIQRFLEPALALSQPRNEFAKNISAIFQKEFGTGAVEGLTVKSSSIVMDTAMLFNRDGSIKPSARSDFRKLSRIFLALLANEHTRSEISLILIIGRYAPFGSSPATGMERFRAQQLTGLIEDALFHVEPTLGRGYGAYFGVTALPMHQQAQSPSQVEFRIIPSEYLHIEVLEKLEKYSD